MGGCVYICACVCAERFASPAFFPFFGGECLDGLEVEVVVQVKVVEVLTMDEEIEHVITLTTHLKPRLHPV